MYNKKYSSRYIMITNGISHIVFSVDKKSNKINTLDSIPNYKDLN